MPAKIAGAEKVKTSKTTKASANLLAVVSKEKDDLTMHPAGLVAAKKQAAAILILKVQLREEDQKNSFKKANLVRFSLSRRLAYITS